MTKEIEELRQLNGIYFKYRIERLYEKLIEIEGKFITFRNRFNDYYNQLDHLVNFVQSQETVTNNELNNCLLEQVFSDVIRSFNRLLEITTDNFLEYQKYQLENYIENNKENNSTHEDM